MKMEGTRAEQLGAGAAAHLSESKAEGNADQDVGDGDPGPLVKSSQQRPHQLFPSHRVVRKRLHEPLQAHTRRQACRSTNAAKPCGLHKPGGAWQILQ